MTEYKKKQVFKQPLSSEKESDAELTAQTAFEDTVTFVPTTIEEELEQQKAEHEIEAIIRPSGRAKWLASTLLISFTGLVAWQSIDNIMTAITSGDWLTVGWSAFVTTLAGLGISAITKELWKLRRLKNHFTIHEQSEELMQSHRVGRGKNFCEQLAQQSGVTEENPNLGRWRQAINDTHSDAEVLQMYEGMVITKQDQQAKAMVAKFSTEAAVLVAVSPLAIADILLVAWRSFKLIDKLAAIYGVELGYWSRLKLFKLVLINMAAAGATEVVTDAGMDLLSMDLAGKLSTRVAQGFGVGILTARLGLKAMSLLRPIPWTEDSRVRLSEIRKGLLSKLKSHI